MGVIENMNDIKDVEKHVKEVRNDLGDLSTLGMSITDKFNQVDSNFDNVSDEFERIDTKILSLNTMQIEEIRTTSISIGNSTVTKIGDSYWLPKGLYVISCFCTFNNNNTGMRRIGIYPQGSYSTTYKQLFQTDVGKSITNSAQVLNMCRLVNVTEEDGVNLDFCVQQTSGSNLTSTGSRLEIVKLK